LSSRSPTNLNGIGKTVLAIHRAKWLEENRTPDDKKVFFTTFTRNLVFDIEENPNSLCSETTTKNVEAEISRLGL
jgi:superfamily I DNA and RNA helicase